MKLPVYNLDGETTKELEVREAIFGVKVKPEVIHQVIVAQQANSRQVLAHTKDKSEVRGGGKKPWKQKGTGNARHGSIRSPLWKGGGVTFGPTKDRNFSKKVNKKQKQLALAMCLSDRVADGALAIFDKLELSEGKTKELSAWLKKIKDKISGLKPGKKFLVVMDKNDKKMIRAAMNLGKVNTILADSLNCFDILKSDNLLFSTEAVKVVEQHYKKIKDKEIKEDKKIKA